MKDMGEAWVEPAVPTFLFTDIEGSTRLWEREPEAMSIAVKEHEEILLSVIATNRGRTVKSTGDGVMAVFEDPSEAATSAVEIQRRFQMAAASGSLPLRIRIGIHRGPGETRGDDWFGPAVNKAARVTDAAHGGQILVTAETSALLDSAGDIHLRDLGRHTLKDLEGDHGIFQLDAVGLEPAFPPLRTPRPGPNNLPVPPTRLVGRGRELRAAHDMLAEGSRLLTLVGPGGIGKTRLAIQIASDVLGRHPDGVWFAELAPLSGPGSVSQAIRSAIGMSDRGTDPEAQLRDRLRRAHMLLILDNFEHLLDEARFVADLMSACPGVSFLVTSRAPLRIRGERVVSVPALSLPPSEADAAAVESSEAGRLFVERARDTHPEFELHAETAAAVAEVVRAVEGIPLALEIAAGRLLDLSLDELRSRLPRRLATLTDGPRDLPDRQRTLRATIEWSWDLLRDRERVLLRRLSVLPGGATLDAASASSGFETDEVNRLLDRLTRVSLLSRSDTENGSRWASLESVRELAGERLEVDDDAPAVMRAAAAWTVDTATEAQKQLNSSEQGLAVSRLSAEADNIRQALRFLLEDEPPAALRLAEAIGRWWILRGQLREGISWLEQATTAAAPDVPHYRAAMTALAALAATSGDHRKAEAVAQRAVELSREAGDENHEIVALNVLGGVALVADDYDKAEAVYRRNRELLLQRGSSFTLAATTNNLGLVLTNTGRIDEAVQLLEEALAIFEELGDPSGQSTSLKYLGTAARKLDRWDEAEDAYRKALKLADSAGDRVGATELLTNLALVRAAQGDIDAARKMLDAAWARAVEAGSPRSCALVAERRAAIEMSHGDAGEAARHWRHAADVLEEAGSADAAINRAKAEEAEAIAAEQRPPT